MRTNWLLTGVAATAAFLGGFLAGCQTYDFEPVEPLSIGKEEVIADISARVLPPNLVLLLDKSDSMDRPEDPSDPDCRTGIPADPICGTGGTAPRCNESTCPTRLSRAREALSQFLAPSGGAYPFRVAFSAFPMALDVDGSLSDQSCQSSSRMLFSLPASEVSSDLAAKSTEVRSFINGITADRGTDNDMQDDETAGGTPTAASLRFIRENVPALKDTTGGRSNFVLLLTDGLPNCNEQHPKYTRADDPANPCRCALTDPTLCVDYPKGCLDDDATTTAINQLYSDGVKTIVVGLGAETASGLGPETLERMGRAGGFNRACSNDGHCGEGDTCNTTSKVCGRSFYQASNGAALAEALGQITEYLAIIDPCRVRFDSQPSDPSLIFVRVDGEQVPSNGGANWVFDSEGLLFQGQVCERIEASTPDKPVKIKVSVIQSQ